MFDQLVYELFLDYLRKMCVCRTTESWNKCIIYHVDVEKENKDLYFELYVKLIKM